MTSLQQVSVTFTVNIRLTGKDLDFDALAKTKELIGDLPLVLHGGTGIPADMIQKAISLGVAKINVNTECQLYFPRGYKKVY